MVIAGTGVQEKSGICQILSLKKISLSGIPPGILKAGLRKSQVEHIFGHVRSLSRDNQFCDREYAGILEHYPIFGSYRSGINPPITFRLTQHFHRIQSPQRSQLLF